MIGISSQDVCHILVVCIFIYIFKSWYGGIVMVEDEVEVIASFASISTFSFPGMPVCEGTLMNLIALWVDVIQSISELTHQQSGTTFKHSKHVNT